MDVGLAFLVVLFVGGLLIWLLRNWGTFGQGRRPGLLARLTGDLASADAARRLRVLDRLPLGPSATLSVVHWDDAELLIWHSPTSAVLLERRPVPATTTSDRGEQL